MRLRFLIAGALLFTGTLRGADAERLGYIYVGHDSKAGYFYLLHPLTSERIACERVGHARGTTMGYGDEEQILVAVKLEGDGAVKQVHEMVPYPATGKEREPNSYVFKEATEHTIAGKKGLRVALTRFGHPVEAFLPTSLETEWMRPRLDALKPGDIVSALTQPTKQGLTLIDLDGPRPPVQGIFVRKAETLVDGKRTPGLVVKVRGKQLTYALPAGRPIPLPGDADVNAAARTLEKGDPIRLTFDTASPDIIRTLEPDIVVFPHHDDGYRAFTAGVSLLVQFEGKSVLVGITPCPSNQEDMDLLAGLNEVYHRNRYRRYAGLTEDAARRAGQAAMLFPPGGSDVEKDKRAISKQFASAISKGMPDPKKMENEVRLLAVRLGRKYIQMTDDGFITARGALGEHADAVEADGKALRESGVFFR